MSRQCGILNISQPYRPPRLVTGIVLLGILEQKRLYKENFQTVLRHLERLKPRKEISKIGEREPEF
jgi:hypothetical protein